jgi:hypothetical protein
MFWPLLLHEQRTFCPPVRQITLVKLVNLKIISKICKWSIVIKIILVFRSNDKQLIHCIIQTYKIKGDIKTNKQTCIPVFIIFFLQKETYNKR